MVWVNGNKQGQGPVIYIYIDENLNVGCNSKNGEQLKVGRRKYNNGSSNSLHRIVIVLENNDGVVLHEIFVQ